jgi:hypothetical protein
MAATDTHPITEELLEMVFSVRSMPRLYNKGQLPLEENLEMAVRTVGGWSDVVTHLGVNGVSGLVNELVKLVRGLQQFSPCDLLLLVPGSSGTETV